jgi:ArsR family transcriptional regulator
MPKALPLIDTRAPICCDPVAAAPMDEDDALEVARRL